MIRITDTISIDESELAESLVRSSGPTSRPSLGVAFEVIAGCGSIALGRI